MAHPQEKQTHALDHESPAIINASHLIEVFMGVSEASHHVELSVEDILSVASVLYTVINNQLNHNFLSLVTVE